MDTLDDAELLEFIDHEIGKPMKDQTTMLPLKTLAKKHLVYNMSAPVRARVYGLFQSFDKMVEVENLAPRLMGANVKKTGKLLVEALKPVGLRAAVRNHCEELHGKEPYKSLEKMFQIIMEKATTHEAVHVARESARGERDADGNRSADRKGRRGGRGDRGDGRGATGRPAVPGGEDTSKEKRIETPKKVTGSSTTEGRNISTQRRTAPDGGCLGCGGAHWLNECRTTSEEKKRQVFAQLAEKRMAQTRSTAADRGQAKAVRAVGSKVMMGVDGVSNMFIGSAGPFPYDLDDGADRTYMPSTMVDALCKQGCPMEPVELDTPVSVRLAIDGPALTVSRKLSMVGYALSTKNGNVQVPPEDIFIVDEDMECVLVGRPALCSVSIDV